MTEQRPHPNPAASAYAPTHARTKTPPPEPPPSRTIHSKALVLLAFIAGVVALDLGKEILVPITFAILGALMLYPVVDSVNRRLRIPYALSAAIVVIAMLAATAAAIYIAIPPLTSFLEQLPDQLRELEEKLRGVSGKLDELKNAGKQVEDMTDMASDDDAVEVVVESAAVTNAALNHTRFITTNFFLAIGLLYFLLASHDVFMYKVIRSAPTRRARKLAITIFRHTREDIAHYFLTVSIINAALGVAIGLAMWALGLPSPVVLGIMAAVLNFAPFIGAIVGTGVVAFLAGTQTDAAIMMIVAPAVYYTLTAIEGSFITPMVLGYRLVINPIVIFLSLIFWGWVWGIPGIFLAVPIMSATKIVCDNVPSLRKIGLFLGR